MKSNSKIKNLGLVALLLLFAALVTVAGYFAGKGLASIHDTKDPNSVEKTNRELVDVYFIREGSLYKQAPTGEQTIVVEKHDGYTVSDFLIAGDATTSYIVYSLSSSFTKSATDYTFDLAIQVNLLNLSTNETTTLVGPLSPVLDDTNPEYVRGMVVAKDGMKLAISTGEKLKVFDLSTGQNADYLIPEEGDEGCTFAWIPKFWVNDTALALTLGCYEGYKGMIYDTESQKFLDDLGITYTSGSVLLDSVEDNQYLTSGFSSGSNAKLELHIIGAKATRTIGETGSYSNLVYSQTNNKIYYIASETPYVAYTNNNRTWHVWESSADGQTTKRLTKEASDLKTKSNLWVDPSGRTLTYDEYYTYQASQVMSGDTSLVVSHVIDLETGVNYTVDNASKAKVNSTTN
ncbi:hypothetical protein KC614_02285 [candidate division WWE3 bacterium]|uniref:WD40 repeat domain-containing protein n=1 Tax=candidate division WWE3 bacterium TaxID=2053526 RepID=A0A955LK59_UNCKA|nr:hypothetical protein [candidate division WWE3 bacterium]